MGRRGIWIGVAAIAVIACAVWMLGQNAVISKAGAQATLVPTTVAFTPAPASRTRALVASATAPVGGLTEPQALAAARSASPDARGLVSGRVGHMRDFDTNQQVVPGDQWVWAVVVSGTFPFSCGPAPAPGRTHAPCPPPGKTRTVILDYRTGKFLEAFGQSGS